MSDSLPYIVLGAGPAGLTAARALAGAGKKVVVVEKEAFVGGLFASPRWKGFIAEFGPHVYHLKRDRIDAIVREHYPADLPVKIIDTRMLIRGGFFDYPLKFWQLVRGLNPLFSARMLGDFLLTSLRFKLFPRPDESFETWGVRRFGRTLYNLCFGQYTERVWGVSPSRLSVRLASQKLHKLNLKDVLIKLLGGRGQEQATYWKEFLYPEEGMGVVFENMASSVSREGGEIWFQSVPEGATVGDGRLISLRVNRPGIEVDLRCSAVISTIPLAALARIFRPQLAPGAFQAGQRMKNRSLILVNLIMKVPRVIPAHWVYLLDRRFRFNRFCEPQNLLSRRSHPDETLIAFEICCDEGDGLWKSSDQTLLDLVLGDVRRIKGIDAGSISDSFVVRVRDAYPVYDLEYDRRLREVLAPFSAVKNLYVTGRQGLFLNTDIHDSMELGLLAAQAALDGSDSRSWYERMKPYLDFKTGGTNR